MRLGRVTIGTVRIELLFNFEYVSRLKSFPSRSKKTVCEKIFDGNSAIVQTLDQSLEAFKLKVELSFDTPRANPRRGTSSARRSPGVRRLGSWTMLTQQC
jgi:hypothetical protein